MSFAPKVARLSNPLGAEVRGFRFSEVGSSEASLIESILIKHQVLFFPEQHPSIEEHVAFGKHFGQLA